MISDGIRELEQNFETKRVQTDKKVLVRKYDSNDKYHTDKTKQTSLKNKNSS